MAGRKRAAPGSAKAPASSSRRTRASASSNAVPDIYSQMLSEVHVDTAPTESPERPAKRRKPGERAAPAPPPPPPPQPPQPAQPSKPPPPAARRWGPEIDEGEDGMEFEDVGLPAPTVQTMYRDSDEEDEDEEEEEELVFEDVELTFPGLDVAPVPEAARTIELDLSARAETTKRQTAQRRKPINKSEKDRRVGIHKLHLLCLLAHVQRRNRWCNDVRIQKSLRRLLDKKMVTYLNPSTELPQFGQTNSLKEGLKMVETVFKTKFQITERGMRRALWADDEEHLQNYRLPEDTDSVLEKSDFLEAAKTLKGSRDVGAQLYCALLRSAGLEARLVCSLQPLSLVSGGPSMSRPPKTKQKPSVEEQMARRPKYDSTFESPGITPNSAPSARRRLGHPNATAYEVPKMTPTAPSRPPEAPKKIRETLYPVYWVEVLDLAHQKWQPVDPLVTQSFWKPKVFEPPASERDNCMAYVVSFEPDGTARDVTRRYAKAYNAKTRKLRIESISPHGERWWRKALKAYDRGYVSDLDQIENNEMAAAEAREPMPRNVADFKDHPLFALERHLRRNEVLVPGAPATGTVGAGSKGPLEKIYRRKDVRLARPKERWFRLGREVRGDAVPVKFAPKPARRHGGDVLGGDEGGEDDEAGAGAAGTPLFTAEQTRAYEPPPVVDGLVPKNRFGNLEVYVPTMVPRGAAYVADELAAPAARLLGLDHAPALTGFRFEGRRGTAVLHGAVVVAAHEAAVRAVAAGLRDQAADLERERRQRVVLRAWKTLLMQLRVRQRIWAGVVDDDDDDDDKAEEDDSGGRRERDSAVSMDVAEREEQPAGEQGGGDGSDEEPQQSDDSAEAGGGFIVEDDDFAGGFL